MILDCKREKSIVLTLFIKMQLKVIVNYCFSKLLVSNIFIHENKIYKTTAYHLSCIYYEFPVIFSFNVKQITYLKSTLNQVLSETFLNILISKNTNSKAIECIH